MNEKYSDNISRRKILKGGFATALTAALRPSSLFAADKSNPLQSRINLSYYARGLLLKDADLLCFASYFPPGTKTEDMELRICIPPALPEFDADTQFFLKEQINSETKGKNVPPQPLPTEIYASAEKLVQQFNSYEMRDALPRLRLVGPGENPHIFVLGFDQPNHKPMGFSSLPPAAEKQLSKETNVRAVQHDFTGNPANLILAAAPGSAGVIALNMGDSLMKKPAWLETVLMHEIFHALGSVHSEGMGKTSVDGKPLPEMPDGLKHQLSVMNRKSYYAQPQLLGPLEFALSGNKKSLDTPAQPEVDLSKMNYAHRKAELQASIPTGNNSLRLDTLSMNETENIIPPYTLMGKIERLILPNGGMHFLDLNHGFAGRIFADAAWNAAQNSLPAEQYIGCFRPDIRTLSCKGGEHTLIATQGADLQAFEIMGGKTEIVCCYPDKSHYVIAAHPKAKTTLTLKENLLTQKPAVTASGNDIGVQCGPVTIDLRNQLVAKEGVDTLRIIDEEGKEKYRVDLDKIATKEAFETELEKAFNNLLTRPPMDATGLRR